LYCEFIFLSLGGLEVWVLMMCRVNMALESVKKKLCFKKSDMILSES
jgi:hypothetical protein